MKTIQFSDTKSVNVKVTFKTILKLQEAAGTESYLELDKWVKSPKNWAKYLSICSVEELTESEALDLIDEANSMEKISQLNKEMESHVSVFFNLGKKEEVIPNV